MAIVLSSCKFNEIELRRYYYMRFTLTYLRMKMSACLSSVLLCSRDMFRLCWFLGYCLDVSCLCSGNENDLKWLSDFVLNLYEFVLHGSVIQSNFENSNVKNWKTLKNFNGKKVKYLIKEWKLGCSQKLHSFNLSYKSLTVYKSNLWKMILLGLMILYIAWILMPHERWKGI